MTFPSLTLPAVAACVHAASISFAEFILDWPFPYDDMVGLMKQGKPTFFAITLSSSMLLAKP